MPSPSSLFKRLNSSKKSPINQSAMSYLLPTLSKKAEVDSVIRDTIDKVLVLRFGRSSDAGCLQLDDTLAKSAREVSKFATVALVDMDSEDVQVYIKYFDITLIPSTVFFFNAHHMKMDCGSSISLVRLRSWSQNYVVLAALGIYWKLLLRLITLHFEALALLQSEDCRSH
ncbi:hypothetical protein SAY87_010124 [Trapa incisa]|uniref:Thioredoxin-like protein 4B n=1 Tax=Trapa incisa TaxID=236973 RepID=A0AAN7JHR5_9MYRT|nr:hypothetical protein SAY87_010124 [Trapa incisa]